MNLRTVDKENFLEVLSAHERPWQESYLAMYSSQWKGITTDPDLMLIPIDDHVVHRADGVFEVMRCVAGRLYQMEAHLSRLERSARAIELDLPSDYPDIRELIKATVLVGGEKECLVKVMLSRGPGSFGANPFDCTSSQLYINVVKFEPPPREHYEKGVSIITSKVPIKRSYFANIKSVDYLPNVMMKMEAIKAGVEYAIGLDENGFVAEGSTENILIVDKDENLKLPEFERTLAGTTAKRILELGARLVDDGSLKQASFYKLRPPDLYEAREIFLCGTSINVLPVVQYDGRKIGTGKPGPIFMRIASLLEKDMLYNEEILTDVGFP